MIQRVFIKSFVPSRSSRLLSISSRSMLLYKSTTEPIEKTGLSPNSPSRGGVVVNKEMKQFCQPRPVLPREVIEVCFRSGQTVRREQDLNQLQQVFSPALFF